MDFKPDWAPFIFCVVLVVFGETTHGGKSKNCDYNIHIKDQEQYIFNIHNFTQINSKGHQQFKGINRYCTVLITTDLNRRIVFDLTYSSSTRKNSMATTTEASTSCHSDYVHVGNDVTRLDVEVMTSYKFCGFEDARHELVSRGNKMWLVFKTQGTRPKELRLNVSSSQVVRCRPDEFTCSPVQCVNRDKVCDGIQDCVNGHDEYCVTTAKDLNPVALSHKPSCFRCGDGTCISPRLPRYDLNWGRGLWYLCDGYPHCPDQWDERPDICLNLLRGKVDAVIQCVPSDLQLGINQSVIMWADHRCDGVVDCRHGEDEIRCKKDGDESPLHADSVTLGFVIGFFMVILIISAFVIHHLRTSSNPSTAESTSDDILLQSTVQSPNPTTYDQTRCRRTTSADRPRKHKDRTRPRNSRRNDARPVVFVNADGKKFAGSSSSDDVFTTRQNVPYSAQASSNVDCHHETIIYKTVSPNHNIE